MPSPSRMCTAQHACCNAATNRWGAGRTTSSKRWGMKWSTAHLLMQPFMVNVGQRRRIKQDGAARGIIEALQQVHNGGLASAALTHQRDFAAGFDVEVDPTQHLHARARGVREPATATILVTEEGLTCAVNLTTPVSTTLELRNMNCATRLKTQTRNKADSACETLE